VTETKRAVVLLSGGLDSATCLAIARDLGFDCYALSVAYGQRHAAELTASKRVAAALGACEHRLARVGLGEFGGSALTDPAIAVPVAGAVGGIPVTYVPARNTVFLALCLAWAEAAGARDLFIGVNALDYSGYPDCRPEFVAAFEAMANLATKAGVEGDRFRVRTPLIGLSKAQIVREGTRLGLDLGMSWSCYDPTPELKHCGRCDSCRLRAKGFAEAGLADPTDYAAIREAGA
jgi:7-cyano-7-deazaguanine synthase